MSSQFGRDAIEIKTPRVLIRTGVASDAAAYSRYATSPANFPYGGCEPSMTPGKAAERIALFARRTADGRFACVLFFSRATGDLVGYGGYNCFEVVDDAALFLAAGTGGDPDGEMKERSAVMADVGIMLDRRFWGQGYGLEILIGLVEGARRDVGAELYRTETDPENKEYRALMERAQLGGCVSGERASYDEQKEVLQWRWDARAWEEAKRKIQDKGRWVDIE
ncbi:gcn5-related n-acetyltransferase [Akanthomyces lecanii RCEF 1005]|uniref:Gcn5-related n-acetyltransferase n=1 Tax=Akanthomyces lecanii RCEF 1005 TaxID=1081108 RepID=A0A168IA58_CORDF|nr:gcn5-related n-acetyltransferase [Akanthomyces lecanii RCEF 1005]